MKIRENAYGYFHSHEVGGTNPCLIEALGSTDLESALDVGFNREVAENVALYWNETDRNLSALIDRADSFELEYINKMGLLAKQRVTDMYCWIFIWDCYDKRFR